MLRNKPDDQRREVLLMGDRVMIFACWRELLGERLDEATAALSAIPGMRSLVLADSLRRGESWPCSDAVHIS